jgi:hypothetical protein
VLVAKNWNGNTTRFLSVQDRVSREGHQYQRVHFDHLFDASDPREDPGLEWAEVAGHVGVAALLEATHFGGSGKMVGFGGILVWRAEMVQKRVCSPTGGYSDQEDREFYMHSFLLEDR